MEAAESEQSNNESFVNDENLISRAQELITKIISSQENPNPNLIHALASLLESQETRYKEETSHFSPNTGRGAHSIGRLWDLIQENDEFFELISSTYLSETRYSTGVKSAAARLLLSCSVSWNYPHVFEDGVLENLKNWVADDSARLSADDGNREHSFGRNKPTDSEMLKTYATGLLSVYLSTRRNDQTVVDDVLTLGLPAKLMHYLRIRVLGELNVSQRDASYRTEGMNMDDNRDSTRPHRLVDTSADGVGINDVDRDDNEQIGEEGYSNHDLLDGMEPYNESCSSSRATRNDDDNGGDNPRRRPRRYKGQGRTREGIERALASASSGIQLGEVRDTREVNLIKHVDTKGVGDAKKESEMTYSDEIFATEEDNNGCFEECKVGTRNISHLVRKAIRAADAEATAANASALAVQAARDAAAELVKTAALEELERTNDEEAAFSAASRAACAVVDAAIATQVSRRNPREGNEDPTSSKSGGSETNVDLEESFILDNQSLALLREKYSIQCLEAVGEYILVLGPVLHEKGVDVCLVLLQRSSKLRDTCSPMVLLPDVLKLISALVAHRKFGALFVDRGGIQKLLAVPRVANTFFGLSSCLFSIGSLQGIMERVCALPSDDVYRVVELALQLLECPQDHARKNAALFFSAAFVFRVVLDFFDAQDGLTKLLHPLHIAASVRSGGNSGGLGLSYPGSPQNDRSAADGLTASEKQVAFHSCFALRQYYRAELLLLVDSLRPNKNLRGGPCSIPSSRAAYKPLDISDEAMDAVFFQIQRDRKLGPAFVKSSWAAVDRFLGSNGHTAMLELCQALPAERYLHELPPYALGVLHIVTLVPYSRKLIVNAALSNNRVGMSVLMDAVNGSGYEVDPASATSPQVVQPALNVLVNLVCPPLSISNKPPSLGQGQQHVAVPTSNSSSESRARPSERRVSERPVHLTASSELKEQNAEEQGTSTVSGTPSLGSCSQITIPTVSSGVGDRKISLGPGAGCSGLAAQLEQGYNQARVAVRSNNGIKVLLNLLNSRIVIPTAVLDCLRARTLACRVLLGLARDNTIAQILTKLQVGKTLSELIRDSGSQTPGSEQARWQAELSQLAIELIAVVTNAGRACTLAATDAAASTLNRLERAAIAAATPITYHSRELLQLIHEHLLVSGLSTTADALLKEAQLKPLSLSTSPTPLIHQNSIQETPSLQFHWPSGRAPPGFRSNISKDTSQGEASRRNSDSVFSSSKKKPLVISCNLKSQQRNQLSHSSSVNRTFGALRKPSASTGVPDTQSETLPNRNTDVEPQIQTPVSLPMKRKLESTDTESVSQRKRLGTGEHGFHSPVCLTPNLVRRSNLSIDVTPGSNQRDHFARSTAGGDIQIDSIYENRNNMPPISTTSQHGHLADSQPVNSERVTLDSLVVQYLRHQHRQCQAPITTLPPLSLLHSHSCPEPGCSIDAPINVTSRLSTREFRNCYSGMDANRRDRRFVYSRFRPWRSCRDESSLITSLTFLGDFSQIATGNQSGEVKIYDSNSGNMLETHMSHQSSVTLVQSALLDNRSLVLSSGSSDVRLCNASSDLGGPAHSFKGCKFARFSTSGTTFAAVSTESSPREILLYDVQTYTEELRLSDPSIGASASGRAHLQFPIHFSPSDSMLLWNGVLWDRRSSDVVYRFDQFTDFGGGGFHPGGNEVIINSEVWDLRKLKLLRNVPSLDQTVIKFNAHGDVIYATLKRNIEDITLAVNQRRARNPLFSAFRTIDASNYTDIATVPVDRCVLDFAVESTDSFVGLVTMDDNEEMFSSARLYEIGRRRTNNDDSDPDDAETEEDDDEVDDSEADEDPILGGDLDSDAEDLSNDEEEDYDSVDDDNDFPMNGIDFDGGNEVILTDGEDEDEDDDDISEADEPLSSDDE